MAAGTEELVVVVAPLVPVLDAGVDGVEEVEGYPTVCSAELHGVLASAAFSATSPPTPISEEKRGTRWRRRGKEEEP